MTTPPTPPPTTFADDRLPTGIPGLDIILRGGVLPGGIYIVQGAPGAGKTIFGNQLCFSQAALGNRALYVTLLAESHSRMMSHMRRMSFFDDKAIPDNFAYIGAFKILEEEGLRGLLELMRREVRARKVNLLVLDGLITVHEKASSELELKKFVHELQTQAVFSGCSMFLLTSAFEEHRGFPPEHTMVDGLVELQTRLHGRRAERQLQVHKLRGSGFLSGTHSYRITENGIAVFPRVEALMAEPSRHGVDGGIMSTGIVELDAMLSGGVDRHSVTVLLGPAGSGKTTVGLQFLSAAKEGENCLLYGFYENPSALAVKAKALNLPIGAMLESGQAEMIWRPATEAIMDEAAFEMLRAVRERGVRRLFIDGIDGFRKLTDERDRVGSFMAALCNELRGLGVTTLASAETDLSGTVSGPPLNGLSTGLSPVAENIVVLRLAALRSETHRLLAVLKARDRNIDMRVRRYQIGDGGVMIESDFNSAEAILQELALGVPIPLGTADARLTGD